MFGAKSCRVIFDDKDEEGHLCLFAPRGTSHSLSSFGGYLDNGGHLCLFA